MKQNIATRLLGLALLFASPAWAQIDLQVTPVVDLLPGITDLASADDGRNRLFIATQPGIVRVFEDGELLELPFLDISERVLAEESQQGLLSITFPPGPGEKTHFYVYYTNNNNVSVVSRFGISADRNRALRRSEQQILTLPQPTPRNNGGRIRFGPEGFLFISLGDGGGENDPDNNGQDLLTFFGKILRLDPSVNEQPFGIPPNNPFVNDLDAFSEIWASGLRNPWRISFDSLTGDLWISDSSDESQEEINFQPGSSGGGENYGWRIAQGDQCNGDCTGFTFPIHTYDRSDENCAIIGGEVYRGSRYPAMDGLYFFGDFCSGSVWSLERQGDDAVVTLELDSLLPGLTTFGRSGSGDLYAATQASLFLLTDGAPEDSTHPISGRMSGQWVASDMNSQGLNLMVGERSNGSSFVFFVWFTYLNGEPYWIVGNENFEPGSSEITIDALRLEGLDFLQRDDATVDGPFTVGSLTIRSLGCDRLEVDWDLPEFGSTDSREMRPLVQIAGLDCSD